MSKTAVITGATTGIGAAYARRLAADGYDLVITGRRKEMVEKVAEDLRARHGVRVDVVIAELANEEDYQKLAEVVKARDDIEMLINNAGYSGYGRHFVEDDIAEHEKMVKVHQVIPMRLVALVVPGMVKRGRGSIINVSSIAAFLAMSSNSVYCATKAFVKSYSRSLSMELKDKGIKVQALCPGFTRTDFAKNYYPPDLYAKMVVQEKRMTMEPETVVDCSLKSLRRDRLVCIPGFTNRAMVALFPPLPQSLYSWLAARMTPFK